MTLVYASGAPLSETSTYLDATFASLGLTPGANDRARGEVDPRRGEVKLSVKALSDDQERSAYQQYRQQVKAEARFTFADLLAKSQKK